MQDTFPIQLDRLTANAQARRNSTVLWSWLVFLTGITGLVGLLMARGGANPSSIAWLCYFAGASYDAVAKTAGRDIAAVVLVIAVIAVIVWRVRRQRADRRTEREFRTRRAPDPSPPGRPRSRGAR